MNISRRSVIGGISGLVAGSTLKWLDRADFSPEIPQDLTILFQGDSITDAGRNRGAYYANNAEGMGQGYVRQIVTELLGKQPGKNLRFYNRGVSGHKVFQLNDRWEDDCLMIQPDVLSILIGVNDFWHTLDGKYEGTVQLYESDFRKLIDRTFKKLPDVKLIIGEPFVLLDGTSITAEKWEGVFEKYQVSAKKVADEVGAVFIPYQRIFDEAQTKAPTAYWCPDGVHPSMAGNYLMAQAWLKAFEKAIG